MIITGPVNRIIVLYSRGREREIDTQTGTE